MTYNDGAVNDEPDSSDKELARAIFARAVADNLDGDEDNYAAIHDQFYALIRDAIRDGEIVVSVVKTVSDLLWGQVNAWASRTTAQVVRDIVNGETALPVEEFLNLPVTVGKRRRSLVRFLTEDDLQRIVAVRQDNESAATLMREEAEKAAGIAIAAMLACGGTLGDAILGGFLPITGDVE